MELVKTQIYGGIPTARKVADKLNAIANENIWTVKRLAIPTMIGWYVQNDKTQKVYDYKKKA